MVSAMFLKAFIRSKKGIISPPPGAEASKGADEFELISHSPSPPSSTTSELGGVGSRLAQNEAARMSHLR